MKTKYDNKAMATREELPTVQAEKKKKPRVGTVGSMWKAKTRYSRASRNAFAI